MPQGTLEEESVAAVSKLLKSTGKNKRKQSFSIEQEKQHVVKPMKSELEDDNAFDEKLGGRAKSDACSSKQQEFEDMEWEEGDVPSTSGEPGNTEGKLTVEFLTPESKRHTSRRRASFKEKEAAEVVHKVHLLCLLARGRLIDAACDDPLIKAALLSLLPRSLLRISDTKLLTADMLVPVVQWFHNNFNIQNQHRAGLHFKSCLSTAIETREGTSEEIAAISVALFRALGLCCRFVCVLDVASLKSNMEVPDALRFEKDDLNTIGNGNSVGKVLPNLRMLHHLKKNVDHFHEDGDAGKHYVDGNIARVESQSSESVAHGLEGENNSQYATVPKRKCDVEFEMQLQMALSATTAGVTGDGVGSCSKDIKSESKAPTPTSQSSAFWSRKVGSPLHWAEIYCNGETQTGRWVHVDAANAIVDGEKKVEDSFAGSKKSLRYVVAFAGAGTKDVTRRYCTKWHSIASKRVDLAWWNSVLEPLKELESRFISSTSVGIYVRRYGSISSLEDMELHTRALTEPLPTNQQAYRSHHLYALERWLTKYEVLHPKGPILGCCAGHPVYPRACVQVVHTKQRWFREGLQVKENELPIKVFQKGLGRQTLELEPGDEEETSVLLYGKWQTEPLKLPHAADGIVPKNDRGQVEVWSEKCLPPGTVHLRLPKIVQVARRLGIDFAPAMVGFEFRNGSSVPILEGIVVCLEFKDSVLEAYAEEEEMREAQEKKAEEYRALSRWTQLLSSMITRQRLRNSYETNPAPVRDQTPRDSFIQHPFQEEELVGSSKIVKKQLKTTTSSVENHKSHHEHVYPEELQSFNEESYVRIKRCPCGFTVEVEEM